MLLPVKYAKRLLTDFIYTLYPRNCLNCSNILVANEDFLCTQCLLDLPKTDFHLEPDNILFQNFAHVSLVSEAFAFWHFNPSGVAQSVLHALKYHDKPEIGRFFGAMYGRELSASREDLEVDLILPIPMHWKKQRIRGYNQSNEIAKGLSSELGIPVLLDGLSKVRHTQSQTKKNRLQRWENVEESFQILKPTSLYDQRIMLVDDVITTGATVSAIADQLVKCDVASITVCALATGVS